MMLSMRYIWIAFRVSRDWNTNTNMHIRDIRMRFQGVTWLKNLCEDAYTRYQDDTSGSHGVGSLIRRCIYEISG